MKKLMASLVLALTALISAPAFASGEALIVDGSTYYSYKLSGTAYHWETPDTNPTAAYFPLRDQTWAGNGSEHLPCENGIHWISNKNVLTVSHCLEGETTTTTTTLPEVTTTTLVDTTSTTTPETTSSVPETTVPVESTSTLAPTTTAPQSTSSSSVPTSLPSTTTPGATTTLVAVTTPPVPTTPITPDPGTVELPKTGGSWTMAAIAATLVALGALTLAASRRKEEECSI